MRIVESGKWKRYKKRRILFQLAVTVSNAAKKVSQIVRKSVFSQKHTHTPNKLKRLKVFGTD
jgi:hypothetical protein